MHRTSSIAGLEHQDGDESEERRAACNHLGGTRTSWLGWSRSRGCGGWNGGSGGIAVGGASRRAAVVAAVRAARWQRSSVRGTGGGGGGGAVTGRELNEVCASNACLVGQVEDDRLVGEEGRIRLNGGEEVIVVAGKEVSTQRYNEEESDTYTALKVVAVMFPCLPERSPVWQVDFAFASQRGVSPRL